MNNEKGGLNLKNNCSDNYLIRRHIKVRQWEIDFDKLVIIVTPILMYYVTKSRWTLNLNQKAPVHMLVYSAELLITGLRFLGQGSYTLLRREIYMVNLKIGSITIASIRQTGNDIVNILIKVAWDEIIQKFGCENGLLVVLI